MITPSYVLTATERVLPKLALDFTTAALDPRVAIARAGNTATVVNSSGVIVAVNANLPRFDFDPITLVCRGLLIEEARTNELLNSLIDGTDLATQSVTVTAAARTLSFYGTGSVVLSGAATATVNGAGAYPARTTYTFTPSAGSLTLTVSGTVQFAQLELGSSVTSFIPTAGSVVTRNADVATMTGTDFSDWFNPTEGTFATQIVCANDIDNAYYFSASNGTSSELMGLRRFTVRITTALVISGGSQSLDLGPTGTFTENVPFRSTFAYKLNDCATAVLGNAPSTDTSVTIPTVDRFNIGGRNGGFNPLNGWVQKIQYWPQRLVNNEVQSFSK